MKRIYLLLLLLNFNIFSTAQMLDTTFGNNGLVITESTWALTDAVLCENGKILVSGVKADALTGPYHVFVSRYNQDGTLDTDFGNEGKILTDMDYSTSLFGMKALPGGKILVGVNSLPPPDLPQLDTATMLRYNADGTADNTFGNDGKVVFPITNTSFSEGGVDFTVLPDGKIFLLKKKPFAETSLIKLNSDGSADASYGNSGTVILSNSYIKISMQADGDILLGRGPGIYSTVAKLHADGSVFTEFGDNGATSLNLYISLTGVVYESIRKVKELADGKILALNYTQSGSNGNSFIKLNADGTPDTGFGQDGVVRFNNASPLFYCTDFTTQPDGKIVACGFKIIANYSYHFIVVRLLPNGTFDTDFGDGGFFDFDPTAGEDKPTAVLMQDDGNLILCGNAQADTVINFCLARIIFDNLNVNEINSNTMTIAPNPFNDSFAVNNEDASEISVYDAIGKEIMKQHINPHAQIDFPFPSGIYLYSLTSATGEKWHGKLIKK